MRRSRVYIASMQTFYEETGQTNKKTFHLFDLRIRLSVQFEYEIGHFAFECSTHSKLHKCVYKRDGCDINDERHNQKIGIEKNLLTCAHSTNVAGSINN